MGFVIRAKLTGVEDALKRLQSLRAALQRQILRRAIANATTPIRKAAKSAAPRESGLLRKSMATKIKTRRNDGVVMAITGPRRRAKQTVFINPMRIYRGGKKPYRVRRPTTAMTQQLRNPTRYAHLMEGGTHRLKPRGFMKRAYVSQKAHASRIFAETVDREIAKVLAKTGGRP